MFSVVAHGGDFWRRNSISSHLLCLRFQCGGVELPRHGFSRALSSFTRSFHVMWSVCVSVMFPCFLNVFATMRQGPPCRAAGWPGTSCTAALRDAIWKRWIRRKRQWLAILDTQMIQICWGTFSEKNIYIDIFVIKVLIPCSAILSWKSWKLVLFAPGPETVFVVLWKALEPGSFCSRLRTLGRSASVMKQQLLAEMSGRATANWTRMSFSVGKRKSNMIKMWRSVAVNLCKSAVPGGWGSWGVVWEAVESYCILLMPLTAFEDPFEGYRLWRFTELSATPSATARSTPSEETKSKCSQVALFHYSTTPFRSTRFGCFLQETLNNVTITFRTTNAVSSAGFIAIQAHSFWLKMKCPYAFSLKKTLGISSPLGLPNAVTAFFTVLVGCQASGCAHLGKIVQAPFGFRIPTVCQASLVDTLADQLHTRSRFAELQSTCQWWKYVGALKSLGGSERVDSQRMTNWRLLCLSKAHTASRWHVQGQLHLPTSLNCTQESS